MNRLLWTLACLLTGVRPRRLLSSLPACSPADLECVRSHEETTDKWGRVPLGGLNRIQRRQRRAFFALSRENQTLYLDTLWLWEQQPLSLADSPLFAEFNLRHYPE